MSWIWDDIKKFFQNIGSTISQALGFGELVNLRDEFTDKVMGESDALIEKLLSEGTISVQDWVGEMRGLIKDTYRAMYELAVGGRENMTAADYGRLGGMLQEQYRYLDRFAADLAEGKLTLPQALNRARMYIESATQAFERAKEAGLGITLPQYPGDGGTQCRANCRCHWDIRDRKTEWACYWKLGQAEHCPDCLEASRLYNPYVVSKGV